MHDAQFSPAGTRRATSSGDGTTRIWDSRPVSVRYAERHAPESLRATMEPIVTELLERFEDPSKVAAHLRADDSLTIESRRAAPAALLRR